MDIRKTFRQATDDGREFDLILLRNQPKMWGDVANPFALLPHSQSPNNGRRMDLSAPGTELINQHLSGSMRRKLRGKQRRLMELPNYRYFRASAPGEVDGFLNEFFKLKSMHFSALGLKNVFEQPGVEPLVREACHRGLANGRPLHRSACARSRRTNVGDVRRHERRRTLHHDVQYLHPQPACAAKPWRCFAAAHDFGSGRSRLQELRSRHWRGRVQGGVFCKQPELLFDTLRPLTSLGGLAAFVLTTASSLKRVVKQNPPFGRACRPFAAGRLAKAMPDINFSGEDHKPEPTYYSAHLGALPCGDHSPMLNKPASP